MKPQGAYNGATGPDVTLAECLSQFERLEREIVQCRDKYKPNMSPSIQPMFLERLRSTVHHQAHPGLGQDVYLDHTPEALESIRLTAEQTLKLPLGSQPFSPNLGHPVKSQPLQDLPVQEEGSRSSHPTDPNPGSQPGTETASVHPINRLYPAPTRPTDENPLLRRFLFLLTTHVMAAGAYERILQDTVDGPCPHEKDLPGVRALVDFGMDMLNPN